VTDLSNWHQAVHLMKIPSINPWTGHEEEYLIERIMVPLTEYQMGNIIDAMGQVEDTGDWWHEMCAIIARAMYVAGLKEISSNRGNVYTYEQVAKGDIRQQSKLASNDHPVNPENVK